MANLRLKSVLIFLMVGSGVSFSSPISFDLRFEVTGVSSPLPPGYKPPSTVPPNNAFFLPEIGKKFLGTITFDDSYLSTDGIVSIVPLEFFDLTIAGINWNPDDLNSAFRGFRGSNGIYSYPDLLIEGGTLTGIVGGVFGAGDVPFVDFFPGNSWGAYDGLSYLSGTLEVTEAVPEPTSALLIGLGLSGIGFFSRKRKNRFFQ